MIIEAERKLFTLAIGFVGLAVVVFVQRNFEPLFSHSLVRTMLNAEIASKTIVNAESLLLELLAVLVCIPLLKATRFHLSIFDSLVVSLPAAYINSLSFCDGFEAWLLIPVLAWPVLHLLAFRLLPLRAIPSIVDDTPGTDIRPLRLLLSFMLSFQFAGLFVFLSGASLPFKMKVVYILFLVGALTALGARLRPHIFLVALALGAFAYNAYLFFSVVPIMKPYVLCP